MQTKTLCISCEWAGKTGDSSNWKCHRPNLMRRNYVEGTVEFVEVACASWNDDGKCQYYERLVPPPTLKPVKVETKEPKKEKSLWKKILSMIGRLLKK